MKRVVYSPKVNVWVKADSGVYDLSSYITDCQVNRKVNQVSTATVTFRNPNKKFTKNGPTFHPMDPIVIFMTRLEGHPVQVFTGYCDTTPYFQLKPGLATIKASCTLKRLLYTYWDPGLSFVGKVLSQRGWQLYGDGSGGVGLQNPAAATEDRPGTQGSGQQGNNLDAVTDGSVGALLYDVLRYIGNWHPDTIWIENIPPTVFERAEGLLGDINESNKQSQKEFKELMKQIIGEGGLGGGSGVGLGTAGGAGPAPYAKVTPVDVGRAMIGAGFPKDIEVLAAGIHVVSIESQFGKWPGWDKLNNAGCIGYWQMQTDPPDGSYGGWPISHQDACTLVPATKLARSFGWDPLPASQGFTRSWYNWWGGSSHKAHNTTTYRDHAEQALKLGPFSEDESGVNEGETGDSNRRRR